MVESTKSEVSGVKESKPIVMEDEEMVIESSEKIELVKSFDDLGLNENLLRGLYAYGFNKPSAV